MALCLRRSIETLPPTHFLTLRQVRGRHIGNSEFSTATRAFLRALGRRLRGDFEFVLVNEWRNSVRHAHLLVRTARADAAEVIRAACGAGPLVCTVQGVRNPVGASNYIFKHTRKPEKKAELPPAGFRGRLFSTSRGFLTKPFQALWRDIQAERLLQMTSAPPGVADKQTSPAVPGPRRPPTRPSELFGPGVSIACGPRSGLAVATHQHSLESPISG